MQGVVCEIFSISGMAISPISRSFFPNSAVKKNCIDSLNCRWGIHVQKAPNVLILVRAILFGELSRGLKS